MCVCARGPAARGVSRGPGPAVVRLSFAREYAAPSCVELDEKRARSHERSRRRRLAYEERRVDGLNDANIVRSLANSLASPLPAPGVARRAAAQKEPGVNVNVRAPPGAQ